VITSTSAENDNLYIPAPIAGAIKPPTPVDPADESAGSSLDITGQFDDSQNDEDEDKENPRAYDPSLCDCRNVENLEKKMECDE